MKVKFDCFGKTDVGCRRPENQDQFLIATLNKTMKIRQTSLNFDENELINGGVPGTLLAVADGVGGRAGGEQASQLAVEAMSNYVLNTMPWFFRLDSSQDDDYEDELIHALRQSESAVDATSAAHPALSGMGTTLTMAYLIWPRIYVVHVGDSRCYLFRQNQLRQVTSDHTVAQMMSDVGELLGNSHQTDIWNNTLWNVIGNGQDTLLPDVIKGELEIGDTLLLCTDGVTKHIQDDEIQKILNSHRSSESMCREIVELANRRGGTDNSTLIIGQFQENGYDLAENPKRQREFVDPTADTHVFSTE